LTGFGELTELAEFGELTELAELAEFGELTELTGLAEFRTGAQAACLHCAERRPRICRVHRVDGVCRVNRVRSSRLERRRLACIASTDV